MRKTIVYIAILGVLGFGVWYFLFNEKNIFGEDEAGFTVTNVADIERIFLANQKGDSISLQKNGDEWLLNNKHKASVRMTEILLQTIKEQFAAYPVPDNAHNNVIKSLSGGATKVELYDKHGVMKVFYVGGQASGNNGTYMLMEGANRPYVVQLPAYTGYISPRYTTEYAAWRDRTVVNLKPEQLTSVNVQYASEDEYLNSFTLNNNNGKLSVALHPELKMSQKLNERRTKTYAGFFQKIGCEGYLTNVYKLDSIIASVPKYCDITIRDTKGNTNNIAIYKMLVNKRSKNVTDETSLEEFDADRYYGVINNNKDTVILQSNTFNKMFRKGYEFFEADQQ